MLGTVRIAVKQSFGRLLGATASCVIRLKNIRIKKHRGPGFAQILAALAKQSDFAWASQIGSVTGQNDHQIKRIGSRSFLT